MSLNDRTVWRGRSAGTRWAAPAGRLVLLLMLGTRPALAERPDIVWQSYSRQHPLACIGFSPAGSVLASAGYDADTGLWSVSNGVWQHYIDTGPALCLAFTPDGELLAAGGFSTGVSICRVSDGQWLAGLHQANQAVCLAFSPDGRRLALTNGAKVPVWDSADSDPRSWRPLRELSGHAGDVKSVAFAGYGLTLASGSTDKTIKLWAVWPSDPQQWYEMRTLSGHTGAVQSLAFSPDGGVLASGSADGTVKLWRVSDGALLRTLTGHGREVLCVAFSPDGQNVASASFAGSPPYTIGEIKLWRVLDGTLLKTYDQETGFRVYRVQYAPDGRFIGYTAPPYPESALRPAGDIVLARNPYHRAKPGDTNCDGRLNFADISPFLLAIQGKQTYYERYPDCNWLNGDCNGDGNVNFTDVDPFVGLL